MNTRREENADRPGETQQGGLPTSCQIVLVGGGDHDAASILNNLEQQGSG